MQIQLNGTRHDLSALVSVRGLLDELGLDDERVAVELNRRILKRTEFDSTTVRDGDVVEVVTFVGGG